jgi:hypothetical protein
MIQQSLGNHWHTGKRRGKPQRCAASSELVHKGVTERPLLQLRKSRAGTFSQASGTAPYQIKLANLKAINLKVLDRRYVSSQCGGGTIASAADPHTGASNGDLIALEMNHESLSRLTQRLGIPSFKFTRATA